LTSNGYKYYTWNLATMWSRAVKGVPLCVVCADKPSYNFLQREGVRCVLWDAVLGDFGPQIVPFGSRQFASLNRLKLRVLDFFAGKSDIQQCLYLDGDIAVYKDIVEDMRQRLQDAPLWLQCDEQISECSNSESCPNLCSGLIGWNHGADAGIFKVTDEALWSKKPEDQVWINGSIKRLEVSARALPRELYPNGARVNKTNTNKELFYAAICLHYNYRVGDSKKADMKRYGDWLLPY